MRTKNIQALENLSLFCNFSGVITIFLGIVVVLLDLADKEYAHVQVGLFVLVTGYAFVKISAKLLNIVYDEKKPKEEFTSY